MNARRVRTLVVREVRATLRDPFTMVTLVAVPMVALLAFSSVLATNVTGMVDPALLKGRIIDSRNVANFSLTITGVKQGVAVTRPALKKDEQASANLTEEEKQKIIIDYLERMLGELTR